jgi:hypothetical protein
MDAGLDPIDEDGPDFDRGPWRVADQDIDGDDAA